MEFSRLNEEATKLLDLPSADEWRISNPLSLGACCKVCDASLRTNVSTKDGFRVALEAESCKYGLKTRIPVTPACEISPEISIERGDHALEVAFEEIVTRPQSLKATYRCTIGKRMVVEDCIDLRKGEATGSVTYRLIPCITGGASVVYAQSQLRSTTFAARYTAYNGFTYFASHTLIGTSFSNGGLSASVVFPISINPQYGIKAVASVEQLFAEGSNFSGLLEIPCGHCGTILSAKIDKSFTPSFSFRRRFGDWCAALTFGVPSKDMKIGLSLTSE